VEPLVKQGKTLEQVIAAKPTADFDAKVPSVGTTGDRFIGQLYAELQAAKGVVGVGGYGNSETLTNFVREIRQRHRMDGALRKTRNQASPHQMMSYQELRPLPSRRNRPASTSGLR